jgi:general secretion pathway protein K
MGERRDRGFALLVVVWVLALMAVLAAGFASDTRSEARQARNLLRAAQAQAMAEAGITLAVVGLLDQDPATQWPADGSLRSIVFDRGTILVTVQDEAGKINLNGAPLDLVAGLLASRGIDETVRALLLDAIATRRRAVSESLPGAATIGPAREEGARLATAANPPFRALDEIRSVPGVSGAVYQRIAPFLTVFSQTPRINPLTASREVLMSLPRVSAQEVENLLATRAAFAAGQDPVVAPLLTGVDRYAGRTTFRAATITAQATTPDGATFARSTVVALTGKPDRPYLLLGWRQVLAADERE